jgi:hypothetical protein
MSRSRRKTPICGITTASSDSEWKAMVARRLRHRVKQELTSGLECDRFAGKRWDLDNPWSVPKDGKTWFGRRHPEYLRK